jgi:hypothetical protein
MRLTETRRLLIPVIALMLLGVPALAHHTAASLDFDTTVELSGTVKEFHWTNPYTALLLEVSAENGNAEEWLIDMGSPGTLTRAGWNATTLKPGDVVEVTAYPLLDDAPGGRAISVTLPDGTVTEQ